MNSRKVSADVVQGLENKRVVYGQIIQPHGFQASEKAAILFPQSLQSSQRLGVRSYLFVLVVEHLSDAAEGFGRLRGMAPDRGADISVAALATGLTLTSTGSHSP